MSAILEARDVVYAYPAEEGQTRKNAIDHVSLTVNEGEFLAILGHNGSGKSTLAKLFSLVISPVAGEIYIDGKLLSGGTVAPEDVLNARRAVGMVFQNPDNQIVATIVEEDVAFGAENLGLPSDEIRRRVDAALDAVGMRAYARHTVSKLSGGQKQRVAIAGALAMKRRCILFDESTAMLDPAGRREVMETIERLNREEGVTVVMITHYMNEAVRADRVAVMDKGKIAMVGTPGEIFSRPTRLWDLGLDVPQASELLYLLKKDGLDVRGDLFDADACAEEIARAIGR